MKLTLFLSGQEKSGTALEGLELNATGSDVRAEQTKIKCSKCFAISGSTLDVFTILPNKGKTQLLRILSKLR